MITYCVQSDALDTNLMTVESCMTRGFAGVQLIGHVNEVCKNGLERAKNALEGIGVSIPNKKIVVNIAPGESKKIGAQYDLAFALNLYLLITGREPKISLEQWVFAGELGLGGELRSIKSVVSYVLAALHEGKHGVVLPKENLKDVRILQDFDLPGIEKFQIYGFSNLIELMEWAFDGRAKVEPIEDFSQTDCGATEKGLDFDDMILSKELSLAAIVMGSGLHSMMLYGTPGTGKSMFAARITSIFPEMNQSDHMEALKISSSCQESVPQALLSGRPPFRSPHHQASSAAILGTSELPGELSLAHGGVLFLDEFPEFRRDMIEALREPLETGEVRVSRAKKKVMWKSKISLIAAANNCPCGWYGSSKKKCQCPHSQITAYRRKVSGPILDRIDIHINMQENHHRKSSLFDHHSSFKQTEKLKEIVKKTRRFSLARNARFSVGLNSELNAQMLVRASGLKEMAFRDLIDCVIPKSLSSRGVVRALRVARTLADIEEKLEIHEDHILQAIQWQADQAAKIRGDDLYGF